MRSRFAPGLAVIFLASLAGCATTPRLGGDRNLQVFAGDRLPSPIEGDNALASKPYNLGPFDLLVIDVFGMPELSNREVRVDETGMISFPLAGAIKVSGKPARDVEWQLVEALRANHVRNPKVTVQVKEAKSQAFTIEGEVKQPGIYPFSGRVSLLQAMALSKGVTEFAKLDDVVIFRTVGGHKYAALYNLKAIRHGQQPDPEIYANDLVMVGDSSGRKLFKDLVTLTPLFTVPIIILDKLIP